MTTGARIEIDGRAFADSLLRLTAALDRPRALYDELGQSLIVSTQQRFLKEAGPDGVPWKPSKRAKRKGGKTLRLTNRLFQSISKQVSDQGLEVGTDVAYAAIHQFGGPIKRKARTVTTYRRQNRRTGALSGRFVKKSKANFAEDHQLGADAFNMPARPFLGFDDDDRRQAREIVIAHLRRASGGGAK